MTEKKTRGQGNNPGVTKRKIIEILLHESDWTLEPKIRDIIASDLGVHEPKSTKIQLASALEEKIIVKDTRSGVNYWHVNFDSDALARYVIDIVTLLPEKDRVLFFMSSYVQEFVKKIAGFLTKTNHPKTRTGYNGTKLSVYWGFLNSEPIHDQDDEELSEDMQRIVNFYRWVVTHSPSFFLYFFQDAAHIDPFLESVLGSRILKTEWKDFDFLYFVGTMGLIVDYSRSDEKLRGEIGEFLVDNTWDITEHTSLKNPERLFQNMIQAYSMLQERHALNSREDCTQKAFRFESGVFLKL